MPDLIKVDSGETDVKVLLPIAEVLLQGGVVAGPTQTFYGLMAAADELTTLNRILEMKGRDGNKPLLLLLDCPDRARCYAKEIPEEAKGLINTFWPGPLSLLLRARPGLPGPVVGPTRTVGVRVEGLPVIRRLVRMIDRAVTGTSANPGGFPPARTAGGSGGLFWRQDRFDNRQRTLSRGVAQHLDRCQSGAAQVDTRRWSESQQNDGRGPEVAHVMTLKKPPENLVIYEVKGCPDLGDKPDFGPDFLGYWIEAGYVFFFFSRESESFMDLSTRHPDLELRYVHRMKYSDWQDGALFQAFRVGPPDHSPGLGRASADRIRGSVIRDRSGFGFRLWRTSHHQGLPWDSGENL